MFFFPLFLLLEARYLRNRKFKSKVITKAQGNTRLRKELVRL